MASFTASPLASLSALVPKMPHGADLTKLLQPQVSDDRMTEVLAQIENALNIPNTSHALPESIRTYVSGLSSENRPIAQPEVEVPDLTKQQCDETMDVIPEEICNLACWGCRERGHSLFTCPYFTTVQRIFFEYRYFCHIVEAKPPVTKWYTEKDAHCSGAIPSYLRKPRPKSLSGSQGPTHSQSNRRPVHYINLFQPDANSNDTLEENAVPKYA